VKLEDLRTDLIAKARRKLANIQALTIIGSK
jgi:hypothetical protein